MPAEMDVRQKALKASIFVLVANTLIYAILALTPSVRAWSISYNFVQFIVCLMGIFGFAQSKSTLAAVFAWFYAVIDTMMKLGLFIYMGVRRIMDTTVGICTGPPSGLLAENCDSATNAQASAAVSFWGFAAAFFVFQVR